MGNCNYRIENNEEGQSKSFKRIKLKLFTLIAKFVIAITKAHFKFHCVVGKGGFGRVWKIERKKFKSMYAMKEMSKVRIVNKKSVNSVINERKLLAQLKHP